MKLEVLLLLLLLLALAVISYLRLRFFATITIYEFQKGLLYKKGSFVKLLGAGKYHYLKLHSDIQIVDIRKTFVTLPGQEILTNDNVNVKISLVGFYEISDPIKAKHQSENYIAEFYNISQLILRDIINCVSIDELLEKKSKIDAQLLSNVSEKAKELGLTVSTFAVKDIMLPANLKRAFSGILEAQKEAQRQLEKARGEQAVLRSLANSSNMYEKNPTLLQARLIQALSSGNNSIVFNADDNRLVVQDKQKA